MRVLAPCWLSSIVALFISALNCTAVAQETKRTLTGTVRSADDQQPIPLANVILSPKGIGTATNTSGHFALVIPANIPIDSLRVSCLGYKTLAISGSTIQPDQPIRIALVKTAIVLQEVRIQALSVLTIIQKAINRIPQNYLNRPHVTKGFYRLYTHNGTNPLELSEAVFDIYNFGYANDQVNLLRLIKSRDIRNERDFHSVEIGQRPRAIFSDDLVKDIANNDIFSKAGLKKHQFNLAGIVDFKGREAYEIKFTEKEDRKEALYRGTVFIDTRTFAFLQFNYGLNPKGLTQAQFGTFGTRLLMKLFNVHINFIRDSIRVNYRPLGDKWVLSDVTTDNQLYLASGRLNYDMPIDIKMNYLVTQVDTTTQTPFEEKLSNNTLIEFHDSDAKDAFWNDHTILLPDFDTEAVIAQLNTINQEINLKNAFEERARKLPNDPAIRIDSMLSFYHTKGQFNGTALIKHKGKVILEKSYGYANLEQKRTANQHTAYQIGSLAKSFTAILISQLANEGKLDLQAPIKTYLPYYTHGQVTIEQLLTHQSGIPNYTDNQDYLYQLLTKPFTLKELVVRFCSDSLESKSGTKFDYSNSNFVVLALIAQTVTSKPFDALLQEHIFNPLHMQDTHADYRPADSLHSATGYYAGVPERSYNTNNVQGAGGIYSSAHDLLAFHNALLTADLLPKDKMAELFKPRVEFTDYKAWYGYGWMIDKNYFGASKKHRITYHPGTDMGFFTMFVRQEDTDTCLILLNNTGDFPRYDLTEMILAILN